MSTNGPNRRSTSSFTVRMRGVMLSPMTGDSGTNFAISAATLCRWPVRSLIRARRSVIRASVACRARWPALVSLASESSRRGPLLGQVLQRPGLVEKPLCVTAAQDDHRWVLHAVHVAGRGQPGHLLAGLVQLALQADHLAQGDLGGVLGVVQQRQVTAVQPGQLRGLRLQLGEFLGRVAGERRRGGDQRGPAAGNGPPGRRHEQRDGHTQGGQRAARSHRRRDSGPRRAERGAPIGPLSFPAADRAAATRRHISRKPRY